LIVGTEEEFHIAGGTSNTIDALRAVRALTPATLICKLGPLGAAAFTGDIPDRIDQGQSGRHFSIDVFNVLGAGDGFMAGLLKGWLDELDWQAALTYANACGALAVSRHGCAPAYPSWTELEFFLQRGVQQPELRHDQALEQIHWSTNRRGDYPGLMTFAFDHRSQMEEFPKATPAKIGQFKTLCLTAAEQVAQGRPGYGILCDARFGTTALHHATEKGLWIARPVEWPGSRPLTLEPDIGPDFGALTEWPLQQVVKVLCFYHPDDTEEMKQAQESTVIRLFHACRRNQLEMLLEIIPSKVGIVEDDTTSKVIERFYQIGVYPDWWKLEPMPSATAWEKTCNTVEQHDPHVRGILVLGLGATEQALASGFQLAANYPLVKGFAVGRTIFADAGHAWFAGELDDAAAVAMMANNFSRLCCLWNDARNKREHT
jgi:5-dehydro-2-deoxygluconokinase